MSKWQKIDPDQIKVGDRVKCVDAFSMFQISGKTSPSKIGICVGGIDFTEAPECRTWYVRKPKNTGTWYIAKPKKSKPPTRPDEPPVGSFFRVDRTAKVYIRRIEAQRYLPLNTGYGEDQGYRHWNDITEPGDTITMLELWEVGK